MYSSYGDKFEYVIGPIQYLSMGDICEARVKETEYKENFMAEVSLLARLPNHYRRL